MRRIQRCSRYSVAVTVISFASIGLAQDDASHEPAASQPAVEATPASQPISEPERRRPRYLNLRYDEDFSYLDGPEGSYEKDFFDPIKNIHLGEDLRLTLGGEVRLRFESETNKFLFSGAHEHDSFLLHRTALFADLKYRKLFRFFVEGIYADVIDRDELLFFIHRNKGDLHQMFFDTALLGEEGPLTLRLGRQELNYGKERLVSASGWGRVRRRFDAAKLLWKSKDWDVDFWYAKPVITEEKEGDDWDKNVDFYGTYATYRGIPRHLLELYFLALDDTGDRVNPNGNAGDRDIYTLGSRFSGLTKGFDYEAEVNGQWGHWAGDTVASWSAGGAAGYTWKEWPMTPRLGTGFEIVGGDGSPDDEKVGTFDQLFRQEREMLGYLVLFGRQNLSLANISLTAWPVPKKVRLEMVYYAFWLTEERDGAYNPGGFPIAGRRDREGQSGVELGHEFDITLGWQIDAHSSILLGYSRFWSDNFIQSTGGGDEPDVYYVQYQLMF